MPQSTPLSGAPSTTIGSSSSQATTTARHPHPVAVKPTAVIPADYDQVEAAAMRILANASVELAGIKIRKKL
jgi:hypothetical protein